jgi:hypothetical protein
MARRRGWCEVGRFGISSCRIDVHDQSSGCGLEVQERAGRLRAWLPIGRTDNITCFGAVNTGLKRGGTKATSCSLPNALRFTKDWYPEGAGTKFSPQYGMRGGADHQANVPY